MDDLVAIMGIMSLAVVGIIAILKGLRPNFRTNSDGVEFKTDVEG